MTRVEKIRINEMVVCWGITQNVTNVATEGEDEECLFLLLPNAATAKSLSDVLLRIICYDMRKSEFDMISESKLRAH